MIQKLLYKIGIKGYYALATLISPVNPKAGKFIKGRRALFEKLMPLFAGNSAPVAWFHASSLGEFEQARPVIELFRQRYPDYKILLTFFSPSGYEVQQDYPLADFVFYLPMDTKSNAREFVQITKPRVAFFVKYDFWFYYFRELHNARVPLFSVSSIFRPSQAFFKSFGGFYRSFLGYITYFFVQNEESIQLLNSVGLHNACITGDTRFERVMAIRDNPRSFPVIENFKGDNKLIVAGSTWKQDIPVIAQANLLGKDGVKLLIAPHELSEANYEQIQDAFSGYEVNYFSQENEETVGNASVLVLDTIGMLSEMYQYADIVYVGGSFGAGLHNVLEPAVFGCPVFFGNKNYKKFQEAIDLETLGGAFPIANAEQFSAGVDELLQSDEKMAIASAVSKQYIGNSLGASEKILDIVEKKLQ